MARLLTLLFFVLIAGVCYGSLTGSQSGEDIETVPKDLETRCISTEQKAFNETLSKIESSLERIILQMSAQQEIFAARLEDFQDQLKAVLNNSIAVPKFQLIGSRRFYIEEDLSQDWKTAARTCRKMGGHLASIKDEEEQNAISKKLEQLNGYWLGSNDHAEKGSFVSLASGKPAFLKWSDGEPNYYFGFPSCIALGREDAPLWLSDCEFTKHFICQADDDV
ncbi:C-type lectin 37Db-like [Drosophila elegans]|uniref:C-type lectin 37Db-like n=1 Tax=Drosophila elegans TaxID=30023 RepID=UPI0007E66E89|nr:C-type lectin 37Db-like [Drosophila elegans]